MEIRITSGRRRSGTDDPQARTVAIGPITIWFSYETPIAFGVLGSQIVIRENDWGPTTGRHLNNVPGSNFIERVSGEEFKRLLEERIGRFFFPRDLDPSCPPPVVADWLQDRGLDRAAEIVRQTA